MCENTPNVVVILNRMIEMVKRHEYYAIVFSDMLDTGLDELRLNDAFGTEGQNDPRGDFRNGDWSMNNIEKS